MHLQIRIKAGKQQTLPAHISGKSGGWVEWPTWEGSREEKLRIGELVHVELGGGKSKFVKVVRFQIFLITRSREYTLSLKMQEYSLYSILIWMKRGFCVRISGLH